MSTPPLRLGTASYILLGSIADAGPCSPYDLKRVMARLVGPLWEVPHSQVYDEAARLAKAGLLVESQEGGGRRRLSYAITDDGRRELVRWLRVPSRERMELRDVGLLKLAFAAELAPGELADIAEDHLAAWHALRAEATAVGAAGPADHPAGGAPGPGDAAPRCAETAPTASAFTLALADAAIAFWHTLGQRLGQTAASEVAARLSQVA